MKLAAKKKSVIVKTPSQKTLLFPKGIDKPFMEMGGLTGAVGLDLLAIKPYKTGIDGSYNCTYRTLEVWAVGTPENKDHEPLAAWGHELGHAVDHLLHKTRFESNLFWALNLGKIAELALVEAVASRVMARVCRFYGVSDRFTRWKIADGVESSVTLDEFAEIYERDYMDRLRPGEWTKALEDEAARRSDAVYGFMEPYLGVPARVLCRVSNDAKAVKKKP